jgi:hypothetical protein
MVRPGREGRTGRWSYLIAAGTEAYEKHAGRHQTRQPIHELASR